MKIDSEHLEILAAIIDSGGLTQGARIMGKSQPSVSRSMAFLEQRVGLPLFESGRRPLQPTQLGAMLAQLGSRIRVANQEASSLVERFRHGHTGHLRVGGSPIFMDGVVSSMIADFHLRYPDIRVELSYGYLEALASALLGQELDVAIVPTSIDQVPRGLNFLPALAGNNIIACREGHPLTYQENITLAHVAAYPWISPPQGSPMYFDLERAMTSVENSDFRISFSGTTLSSILSVLLGSDSVTVLPYSVFFQLRRTVALAILPVQLGHPERTLGLLTVAEAKKGPAARQFFDHMTAQLHHLRQRMDHERRVALQGD